MLMERITQIIECWFGSGEEGYSSDWQKRWWRKSESFDQTIRDEFADDLERAHAGEYDAWLDDPEGRLALILLLDQFPRQIFRNTARAYDYDVMALAIAHESVALGHDQKLPLLQRSFFYMPYEHSEAMADQESALALFNRLLQDSPEEHKGMFKGFYDFAKKHYDIIARFGRYPHRNALLGRESTQEEQVFLTQPGFSF